MVFHICHPQNDWPPDDYLKSWGKPFARRFCTLHIDHICRARSFPYGTYLFTDLELFSDAQKRLLADLWEQLSRHPKQFKLQNHPQRVLPRYDFLESLSDSGQNQFRALRLNELPSDLRFPVFLRMENDHNGTRSPLLQSWSEIETEVARLVMEGLNPNGLLAVEYLETADEWGVYRKYSYFKIGDRIIPRHIFFSRNWVNKDPDIAGNEQIEEERQFLESNPHEEIVRSMFELNQIDYGRIDYSIKDGQIQVWEINTNPIITLAPHKYRKEHIPNHDLFGKNALDALLQLDSIAEEGRIPISLRWPLQTTNHNPQTTGKNGGGGEN